MLQPIGQETAARTVLTREQLDLPGLYLFGHGYGKRAELPLISHTHRRIELLLVLSGSLPYTCGDVSYQLYPGDGIFVRPGEAHASGEPETSEPELLWFQLDPDKEEGFLGLPVRASERLLERLASFGACQFTLPEPLLRQWREAFSLFCKRDFDAKCKAQTLFCYCLFSLLDSRVTRVAELSEGIRAVRHYIKTHIRETIDLDELMLAGNMSYGELRQRCRQELNCGPREYIQRCKLEDAKRQVARTGRTFGDIAFSYGFSSAQYFKLRFRQYTGYSPAKYRKHCRQGKLELPE